jgi:hypothetical protein
MEIEFNSPHARTIAHPPTLTRIGQRFFRTAAFCRSAIALTATRTDDAQIEVVASKFGGLDREKRRARRLDVALERVKAPNSNKPAPIGSGLV